MDKFNNQFATRKLRQEANNNWPETITSRYQDEYLFIHDENKPGFYNVKDLDTGKIVGRFGFNIPEKAVEFAKDKIKPQGGRQSSGLGETSMTSAGATFTPGDGEQTAPRATKKVVKKKLTPEEKDVEPKLAAGKANIYAKEKWGWTPAPSIPNRPSKGGFIYKQLFEELSQLNENYSKFKTETKTRGKSDQFHQAIREVRKKVQEINRLFEYVSRLKGELSEGEGGLKYKMHTEKALQKIKEMVLELNQNIKKFK